MKRKNRTLSIFITLITSVVLASTMGCIKKRADQPVQGSGLANGDVVEKNDVLNVVETVQTKEKFGEATKRSYKLTIEDSAKEIFDDYGYVEYTTDSKVLNNGVKFIGKENTKYELRRKLEGKKLIIYKVGNTEDISYIEKTSLVKPFGSDKIGVPLVSFPVAYYKVVKIKDADNRETNQKREEHISDYKKFGEATHIKVEYSSRTEYSEQNIDKSSLFPKSFFENREWFLSIFKTDSSDYVSGGNRFEFIRTEESRQDGIFRRVKFSPEDDSTFMAKSSVVPQEVSNNRISEAGVAPLKVEWVKLKVEKDLAGEEVEAVDNTGSYKTAKFFRIDFKKSFNEIAKSIRRYKALNRRDPELFKAQNIKEVIIAKDLFSFIIENEKVQYRVNFMERKDSDYIPVSAQLDDYEKRFPLMIARAPLYNESLAIQVEDDFEKVYRLVRHNPKKKKVVYHISEESPAGTAVEETARRGVKYMNDAFRHIYKDQPSERIEVSLSNVRVRRGDPRYNTLDYNSEQNTSTYGGLGNPYFDEVTGEVISATTYVYYGISLELLRRSLSEYMQSKTGIAFGVQNIQARPADQRSNLEQFQAEGFNVQVPYRAMSISEESLKNLRENIPAGFSYSFLPVSEHSSQSTVLVCEGLHCNENRGSIYQNALEDFSFEHKTPAERFRGAALNVMQEDDRHDDEHNVFNIGRRSAFAVLERKCDLTTIEQKYKAVNGSATFFKEKETQDCLQLVLVDAMLPSVVHELIHNFGMSHNMQGSSDGDNFLTADLIKEVYGEEVELTSEIYGSNSIMDYFEYRTDSLPYPSTYDWATLRYIYRQEIQDSKTGEFKSLAQGVMKDILGEDIIDTMNVEDAEKALSFQAREFKYCQQVEIRWGTNPLCQMFDIGTSPTEIVKNYIDEYTYEVNLHREKGIKADFNARTSAFMQRRKMREILKFYHQWRKELYLLLGDENKYLESYSSTGQFYKDFSEKVMSLDEAARKRVLEYYHIRNIIYNFFKDQVFTVPYTCMYNIKDKQDRVQAKFIDFDEIYREIEAGAGERDLEQITGCESTIVQKHSRERIMDQFKLFNPKAKESDFEFKFITSLGQPIRSYSYSIYQSRRSPGAADISGFTPLKLNSAWMLLTRQMAPDYGKTELFFPSFMDEPEFRENFEFFLKSRYVNGVSLDQFGGAIRQVALQADDVKALKESPAHAPFRDLLKSYGENGIQELDKRLADVDGSFGFDFDDPAQGEILVTSPYVQNLLIRKSNVKNQGQSKLVMREVFGKTSIDSFVSESSVLPFIASAFRSGLTVPRNLSVTKERTKKFAVGLSSDYSYMERIKQLFEYVADLGAFIVYSKDAESTFSRDLIMEVDKLNGAEEGLNHPMVVQQNIQAFIGEVFVKLAPKMPVGKANLEALTGEERPTVVYYMDLAREISNSTNRLLGLHKDKLNGPTVEAIVMLADGMSGHISRAVLNRANRMEIDAVGELGLKLNYGEALAEIAALTKRIETLKEAPVVLPSDGVDIEKWTKIRDKLVEVITDFQTNQLLTVEVPSQVEGEANQVVALIAESDFMKYVESQAQSSAEQRTRYVLNGREAEEKKELLRKFLMTLAFSR